MKSITLSESELQMHIVKLLEAYGRHDIDWHHPANGEERRKSTAARLKKMGVRPGVADLMFLIDSQSIAFELKTEVGTQSKEQAAFQERFERAGGRYFIAFGLDQALGVLSAINAFRPNIKFANALDRREARKRPRHRNGAAAANNSSETVAPG